MFLGFPILLLILVVGIGLMLLQRDRAKRGRLVKRVGVVVMAFATFIFAAFVVGESFQDPGGWKAAALVATWAVPLVLLGALAWFRPDTATRVLAALVVVVIGVSVWFAVSPAGWRSFENGNGPVRAIGVFALAAAIAFLGLKRARAAGVMLLLLGIVPVAVSSLGSNLGFVSLVMASAAPVITGALYLWSSALTDRSEPTAIANGPPGGLPKAA